MANLTITAANVRGTADEVAIASAGMTAGQVVFKDANGQFALSDANDVTKAKVLGVLVSTGVANQSACAQKTGTWTPGATLSLTTTYFLSATAGGICPEADLTTGDRKIRIGYPISTTEMTLDIKDQGVVL